MLLVRKNKEKTSARAQKRDEEEQDDPPGALQEVVPPFQEDEHPAYAKGNSCHQTGKHHSPGVKLRQVNIQKCANVLGFKRAGRRYGQRGWGSNSLVVSLLPDDCWFLADFCGAPHKVGRFGSSCLWQFVFFPCNESRRS